MNIIIQSKGINGFYTPEKCHIAEVLNTSAHPERSIALARVEPGINTEWHRLQHTDEMYYIRSGKGQFEMDGEFIGIVEKDDLVFIPGNSNQQIKSITDQDIVFLCVCNPRFEQGNDNADKLHLMNDRMISK
jgi:mannose-6-phosphate isomerase-like protein (cupin superfamily)